MSVFVEVSARKVCSGKSQTGYCPNLWVHFETRSGSDVALGFLHGAAWGPRALRPTNPARNSQPRVSLPGGGGGGGTRGESQAFPHIQITLLLARGHARSSLHKPPSALGDPCTPEQGSPPRTEGFAISHRSSARQFPAPNSGLRCATTAVLITIKVAQDK